MKKALFFDLDGTLWDATSELTKSWNEAMVANNEPFRFTIEKTKSVMGLTPKETCPIFFPGVDLKEGLRLFAICLKNEIAYLSKCPGTLYPNEEKVLGELSKKYDLYIVSNSDKGYVENYLSSCKMTKYFKGHICCGDTGYPKWKNIMYLQEKEGIDEVIYIGDTNKDKVEATKANVSFIHAAYGFGAIENDKYFINSLRELPSLVEKIFAETK